MRLDHHKVFSCQECGYTSQNSRDLKRHMIQHTGKKPFKCNLCEFKSGYKSELRRNNMRIHLAVKPKNVTSVSLDLRREVSVDNVF